MRSLIFILLLSPLITAGQTRRKEKARYDNLYSETVRQMDIFNLDANGYHGQTKTDTIFYSARKIKAIGSVAIDRNGNLSMYKVGKWLEFYENGHLKSFGDYQMDFVWTCSSARPTLKYYSYKTNYWTYYYDNGQVMAQGVYDYVKVKAFTGIADQYVKRPVITNQWFVYSDNGQVITEREKVLKLLDSF